MWMAPAGVGTALKMTVWWKQVTQRVEAELSFQRTLEKDFSAMNILLILIRARFALLCVSLDRPAYSAFYSTVKLVIQRHKSNKSRCENPQSFAPTRLR